MTAADVRRLREIVGRMEGIPIGVVGDLVADLYVYGIPGRVSREAPVLVLRHEREEMIPGGAANTANNLRALGAEVHPVGLVGEDSPGRDLVGYFAERGVDTTGILAEFDWQTITKTRILAGAPTRQKHQIVRIDREPRPPDLPDGSRCRILTAIRGLAPRMRGWVFSDYGYGVASPGAGAMLEGVRVADSRFRAAEFKGFTALTPNDEEAAALVGHPVETDGQTRKAGRRLLEMAEVENVVITRGNEGMALFRRDGSELFLPASGTDEVTDVTGAGDTVTGVLTLALAAGAAPEDAVRLANHAAGFVVTRAGAATLTREDLIRQFSEES